MSEADGRRPRFLYEKLDTSSAGHDDIQKAALGASFSSIFWHKKSS